MLSKDVKNEFNTWAVAYFKDHRTAQSKDIFNRLKEEMPVTAKKIEKAGKKIGGPAYIGRHLLPGLAKEGWLQNKDRVWSVNITPDRCPYCLKPIDEVYLIDIDENRYCSADCMDEYEDAEPPYDSYWDDYIALFYEFEDIYYRYQGILDDYATVTSKNPEPDKIIFTHRDILKTINHIEEILPNYDYILLNGGDDGPVAGEMNRMVESMQEKLDHLREMADNIAKIRQPQRKYYSITIDPAYLNARERKMLY